MQHQNQPTLAAECDCALIDAHTPSLRFLEWSLYIPSSPLQENRPPLNIALVIDRSRSMTGGKLADAKQAAYHLLDHLDGKDRVALIAYCDEVEALSPSVYLTPERSDALKNRIEDLTPCGSTDLGGGWLNGAQQVAMHQHAHGINRTLLFTDGQANTGVVDKENLASHAGELFRRGVSTSAFGIGADANGTLMEAMALQGGGRYYSLEHACQLPELLPRELKTEAAVCVRGARLHIRLPEGVATEILGDLRYDPQAGHYALYLGDLREGEYRSFLMRILTPPAAAGQRLCFQAEMDWLTPEGTVGRCAQEIAFTYADRYRTCIAPRNQSLQQRVAFTESAASLRYSVREERSRRRRNRTSRGDLPLPFAE